MKTLIGAIVLAFSFFSQVGAETRVGVILPLSGDFGYFGEAFRQGITLALERVKSTGVTVPEMLYEDDKCLAKDGVAAFRKLVDESKVSLVVGPACSTAIQSVAPIARRSTIPVIFLLDTGENVSSFPDPLYSFGFDPPKMASALADEMRQRGLKKVGLITEEEEYAVLIARAFEKRLESLGIALVGSESIPVNSSDFRSSIARILNKKPDALFFSSAYQSGVFLKQLRAAAPNIPVYGNDTMCVADTIVSAGGAAEGAVCGNVVLDESKSEVREFRATIESTFKKAPDSLFYHALGYDSVFIALQELGYHLPQSKTLLGVGAKSSDGMYSLSPQILEIRQGKIVPIAPKL